MTVHDLAPVGLHPATVSPVEGLFVLERRLEHPRATVICVHGGLDRGGSFARVARRLEDCDVVAYDRRGYQRSRDVSPLGLTHHADDLIAIAASESRHPVVVLGHSYGGVVAVAAALREPGQFSTLVLYEPPLPWFAHRSGSHGELSDDPELEAERFFRRMVSDGAWDRLGPAGQTDRRSDGPALLDDLRVLRGPAPFNVTELRVPTLYSYGDGPNGPYYDDVARQLRASDAPVTSSQLTHAGHGAHLTKPDALARLVETMVRP